MAEKSHPLEGHSLGMAGEMGGRQERKLGVPPGRDPCKPGPLLLSCPGLPTPLTRNRELLLGTMKAGLNGQLAGYQAGELPSPGSDPPLCKGMVLQVLA